MAAKKKTTVTVNPETIASTTQEQATPIVEEIRVSAPEEPETSAENVEIKGTASAEAATPVDVESKASAQTAPVTPVEVKQETEPAKKPKKADKASKPTASEAKKETQAVKLNRLMNIRKLPGMGSQIIGTRRRDTVLTVLEVLKNGWLKVSLENGKEAYVLYENGKYGELLMR